MGRGLPGREEVDHREWEGDRVMRSKYILCTCLKDGRRCLIVSFAFKRWSLTVLPGLASGLGT